jgi:hypothetical protein
LIEQVLYMTYHRLLMIASGILVNEYDMQQAKKLHDKDGSNGKITPTPQNLDSSGDAPPRKGLDQVFLRLDINRVRRLELAIAGRSTCSAFCCLLNGVIKLQLHLWARTTS